VADATDLTATLVARDDLPPVGRDLVAAVAAAATAMGAKLVLKERWRTTASTTPPAPSAG
jgi:hypothetical protein